MGIANSRKETRHYNASPQSPHPALTNQEAELYFQRIDILALDIVRIRLGLPKIAVEDEVRGSNGQEDIQGYGQPDGGQNDVRNRQMVQKARIAKRNRL